MHPIRATREEIETFLDSLTVERETFQISNSGVLESDILIVKRVGNRIRGVAGVKKLFHLPFAYVVVSNTSHPRVNGYKVARALVEAARDKYPFICAIVLNQNDRVIRVTKRLGFRSSFMNYKYHFIFLPMRPWSSLLYPIFALLFPIWCLGFFFLKKNAHLSIAVGGKILRLTRAVWRAH